MSEQSKEVIASPAIPERGSVIVPYEKPTPSSYNFFSFDEDTGEWTFTKFEPQEFREGIPPGVYRYANTPFRKWLYPHKLNTEALIQMPDDLATLVLRQIANFCSPEVQARYKAHQVIPNLNILLHGAPGTGKSYSIYQAMNYLVSQGYIVLIDPRPNEIASIVKMIRECSHPDDCQKILIVWEELDSLIREYETALLNFLDGINKPTDVICIATTNYIQKLPPRMTARPGRWNTILESGPPNELMREAYFKRKLLPEKFITEGLFTKLVKDTEGLVMDFLREFVTIHFCQGYSYEYSIDILRTKAGLNSIYNTDFKLNQVFTQKVFQEDLTVQNDDDDARD